MTNQKPLQSQLLENSARITLAATKPFHSLKDGESDNDAVFRLQRGLQRIEKHSGELPSCVYQPRQRSGKVPDIAPALRVCAG
jgi:hypothetical protein